MATDIMRLGLIISATDKTGKGINSAVGNLGKLAGALGLASVAYMGFDAIKRYDDAIQSLSAVTGVTGKGLEDMKSQVMSLAKESKKSGDEIAKAFENVGSNMSEYLSDPKGLRMITAAGVTLSKAARMEVAPALDNLTTIMNQFDLKAKDAAKSVNILTAGEIVGNVRTADISTALQEFGASASSANVNLGESVALIEVLGKKLKKEQIGVAGRNILVAMAAAKGLPKEGRRYLEAYGVSTAKLMNSQTPLIERLTELKKISGDATAMVKVFGKENITAATILLKNLPMYKDWEGQIQNTNKAQDQANINSKSFINRLAQMKSAFDNILIAQNENTGGLSLLGNVIGFAADHMKALVNIVTLAIGAYASFWTYTKLATAATWINNQATLFSAIAQGKNVMAFAAGTFAMKAFTVWQYAVTAAQWLWNAAMTANPIGLIIVGIGALVAGIIWMVKHWDTAIAALKRFGGNILKWILAPVSMALKVIGKLTGAKWAIDMGAKVEAFRTSLGVDASKSLASKALPGNSIGGTSLNYSPNVIINGPVKEGDKAAFADMLKANKREVVTIMKEHQNNNARLAFANK